MASNTRKSAPFSSHARGVPLFDRARFADVPRHAARALLLFRDIGSSSFWFLTMQTWTTLWSVSTSIFALIFFTYYGSDYELAADIDWSIIGFIVVLPLVGFIWIAFMRRERCLNYLSETKTLMLHILHSARLFPTNQAVAADYVHAVCNALFSMCGAMNDYFMPSRFYARSYPYFGYKSAMIQIALDKSRHQREIRTSLLQLTAAVVGLRESAGLPPHLETQLHDRIYLLQTAIDKMSNVKEFRTPQGIRSLSRMYISLIIPLFFGPYWAFVGSQTSFAFALFLTVLWQIALCGLLNVAIDLEDPFDNYGLDGIFIDEQLYEVEQAIIAVTGGDEGAANGELNEQQQQQNGGAGPGGIASPFDGPMNNRVVRVETDTV